MDNELLRKCTVRLISAKGEILKAYPFFGRLLMRLSIGFKECETAYTDMQRIVFDPDFADRLTDRELQFVALHELLHCVLKHCVRGKGKLHRLYNIACDIVVNSMIFDIYGIKEMKVDGEVPMHLAPNGAEGREYNAEQVYHMLLDMTPEQLGNMYSDSSVDSHEVWGSLSGVKLSEIWSRHIKEAVQTAGFGSGIPDGISRMVEDVFSAPKVDWRQILHDHIQNYKGDFTFSPPDKRYSGDFLLPMFVENIDGSKVEKIWFVIDTSGSVTDKAVAEALKEARISVEQIGNMTGHISFFDHEVSEPIGFEGVDDIRKIKPVGGGGTSFERIFEKMPEYFKEELPAVIIIITDGYATFPSIETTRGVPVVWLMVDSTVQAPWGETVKIKT